MTKQYTALVDIDTLIIHAALAGQKTSIKVVGKNTGRTLTFNNRTEFYGHWKKKNGGWLNEFNTKRIEKGLEAVRLDVFDIQDVVELVSEGNVSAETIVKGRFKNKIEAITSQPWCKDFVICFGTGTNFRYDLAQTVPYKSERPQKPILYDVVKDYMLWKYKDKIVTYDGVESDDIISQLMWESWIRSGKDHDKLDSVAVFIDKDLGQIPCLQYNFDKPELGLVPITQQEAAENLACQLLQGDTIDTIPGLPQLPDEMFEKYGIRKPGKGGIGEKTARALLSGLDSPKDVFERVVEAYRGYYGEEVRAVYSFRDSELSWNWLNHLNEQYQLLRMRTDVNKDVGHVRDFLKAMEIEM